MKQVDPAKLILAGAAALFLAACADSLVSAQAPAAEPPVTKSSSSFKNLKVFPAEIPRDRLIAAMKNFSTSLGVKCTFCHVGEEGKPASMDFASDANDHKEIARTMMLMVRRINEQDFAVKDFSQSKVTCYTCHRGGARPLTAAPSPTNTPPKPQAH